MGFALITGLPVMKLSEPVKSLYDAVWADDITALDAIRDSMHAGCAVPAKIDRSWTGVSGDPAATDNSVSREGGWWTSRIVPSFPQRSVSPYCHGIFDVFIAGYQYNTQTNNIRCLTQQLRAQEDACLFVQNTLEAELIAARKAVGEMHHIAAVLGSCDEDWGEGPKGGQSMFELDMSGLRGRLESLKQCIDGVY